jgi:hypothetical protein
MPRQTARLGPPVAVRASGRVRGTMLHGLMANSQGQGRRRMPAVVPRRLAAPVSGEVVLALQQEEWSKTAMQVASDWQVFGDLNEWWELATAPAYGRASELVGLIASAGEQFALARAALVETELWRAFRKANPVDATDRGRGCGAGFEMGHRAMAEQAAYYLLGTGHGLVNVTGRALAFDSELHPPLLRRLGTCFPVRSADRKDWVSLNADTTRRLRRVARESGRPPLRAVAGPVSKIINDDWKELDRRRGGHYHRRRPQSAGVDGVPFASPWVESGAVWTLDFGGREYTDGDGLAHDTSALARRVLAQLAGTMETLLQRVQDVLADVQDRAGRSSRPS